MIRKSVQRFFEPIMRRLKDQSAMMISPRFYGSLENSRVVMCRFVMKFGGTSVANIDRIRNVARHVKREVDAGHEVAVVVSAMAGKNNELVAWGPEESALH